MHESLSDREELVRTAPHLVRPLRLFVPVYAGDPRPAWKIRAGLVLYDALSSASHCPATAPSRCGTSIATHQG